MGDTIYYLIKQIMNTFFWHFLESGMISEINFLLNILL